MKVLMINAVYGHSSTGTITKSIRDVSIANGIDAYVAYSKGNGFKEENTYEIGCLLDHKAHALFSRINGKQGYFSKYATTRLIKFIKKINPDIVHLHNLHSNYINLNKLLKHLAETKTSTIITMHDCWYFTGGCFHYANIKCDRWKTGCGSCPKRFQDTPAYLSDRSKQILNDRIKYLSAIPRLIMVGCSEWIADECRKSMIHCEDIKVIPNGFDMSIFNPSPSDWRKKLNIPNDKFIILAPATKWLLKVNQKTFDYFVKNMSNDMVLVLFGIDDLRITESEKIRIIGHITSPKAMAEIYSMADVMVNCSREDTLSSINIEAQACGTPVVTYDDTGNNETVDGKCGYAIATGNFEELFIKVQEIKHRGKSAFYNDCVRFAESNYEKQSNYRKYIELYHEIYNTHN